MASLRINVIESGEPQQSLPLNTTVVRCDRMRGVELTGPLAALLDHVDELARLGLPTDAIVVDLVVDLRSVSHQLSRRIESWESTAKNASCARTLEAQRTIANELDPLR
jgi:hypothetical protein